MQKKIEKYAKEHLDKVLHFLFGMMISLLSVVWLHLWVLVPIVAAYKEFKDDKKEGNKFDEEDLFATCLGGIPILVILFINYLIKM